MLSVKAEYHQFCESPISISLQARKLSRLTNSTGITNLPVLPLLVVLPVWQGAFRLYTNFSAVVYRIGPSSAVARINICRRRRLTPQVFKQRDVDRRAVQEETRQENAIRRRKEVGHVPPYFLCGDHIDAPNGR